MSLLSDIPVFQRQSERIAKCKVIAENSANPEIKELYNLLVKTRYFRRQNEIMDEMKRLLS